MNQSAFFIRPKRASAGLDMAPLIDVVFLLLIFFMLTSSFLQPSIPLTLPKAAASDDPPPAPVFVSVDTSGAVYINQDAVPRGNFSAALGSLSPVSTSGSFGFVTSGTNPGWFWSGATSPGTGLALAGLPANDGTTFGNYSIGMRFSMSSVTGLYKRLMLFKSGQDFGPYVANGAFVFYDGDANPSGGSIATNTPVDFVLTRSGATKQVNGYVNGSSTPIFTFTDTANDGQTGSIAPRTIQFFIDNGPEFSAAGGIGLLRVWDGPLTSAEIPNAMTVVPEPAAGLLAIVGAATAGWWIRRRRTDAP